MTRTLVECRRAKKCGAESSDPNRHSQPRLPGSVVGDPSMRYRHQGRQDYEGKCPPVTRVAPRQPVRLPLRFSWKLVARSCSYFVATSECVMACTDKAMRFC